MQQNNSQLRHSSTSLNGLKERHYGLAGTNIAVCLSLSVLLVLLLATAFATASGGTWQHKAYEYNITLNTQLSVKELLLGKKAIPLPSGTAFLYQCNSSYGVYALILPEANKTTIVFYTYNESVSQWLGDYAEKCLARILSPSIKYASVTGATTTTATTRVYTSVPTTTSTTVLTITTATTLTTVSEEAHSTLLVSMDHAIIGSSSPSSSISSPTEQAKYPVEGKNIHVQGRSKLVNTATAVVKTENGLSENRFLQGLYAALVGVLAGILVLLVAGRKAVW